MNRITTAILGFAFIIGLQSQVASAQDSQPTATAPSEAMKAFNDLFGEDVKKVTASNDMKDDVQLAAKLLAAARDVSAQAELLAVICNKAYELGIKDPAGYQTAVDAMKLLAEKVADAKSSCVKKLADVVQMKFRQARNPDEKQRLGEEAVGLLIESADARIQIRDIQGALDDAKAASILAGAIKSATKEDADSLIAELTQKQQIEKQILQLKAKLQGGDADATIRPQIVKLYLIELDDPAEAQKNLGPGVDEATTLYIPLAVKNPDELKESAAGELADWYYQLLDSATSTIGKENVLNNARDYYELFLKLHTAEDLARTKATLTLKKIDDALAKLTVNPRQQWIDLLKIADMKYSTGGNWEKKDQKVIGSCESGPGPLTIPISTQGSYILQGTLTVTKGSDAHFVLPTGATAVDLNLFGWGGEVCGLNLIGGKMADQNVTANRNVKYEPNKEYSFEAKVHVVAKDVSIEVSLNGKQIVKWQGPANTLTIPEDARLRAEHAFAISPYNSSVTFSSLKLRILSGSTCQTVKVDTTDSQGQATGGGQAPTPTPVPVRPRVRPRAGRGG